MSSLRKTRKALRRYVNALWKQEQQLFSTLLAPEPFLVVDGVNWLYAHGIPGEAKPRDGGIILPDPCTGEPVFLSVMSRRATT